MVSDRIENYKLEQGLSFKSLGLTLARWQDQGLSVALISAGSSWHLSDFPSVIQKDIAFVFTHLTLNFSQLFDFSSLKKIFRMYEFYLNIISH